MVISYATGLEILRKHREQIVNGQIKVLLFFLGSMHDENFLKSITGLARDLDNITGPHCLAVTFMPPPKQIRIPPDALPLVDCKEFGDIPEEKWPQFAQQMTANTYELARFFEIPYDELPCLVFCNPKEITEIAVLRMRNKNLSDVYSDLRNLFFDWYSENKMILDEYDYLLATTEYSLFNRSTSTRVKLMVEDSLRKRVIPLLDESLGRMDGSFDRRKLNGIIKGLYSQPKNIKPLQDFMRLNNLAFEIEGQRIAWDSLPRNYGRLLENNKSIQEAKENLIDCLSKLPDFPLGRVQRMETKAEIKRISSKALKLVNVKTEISTVSVVKRIFGL